MVQMCREKVKEISRENENIEKMQIKRKWKCRKNKMQRRQSEDDVV